MSEKSLLLDLASAVDQQLAKVKNQQYREVPIKNAWELADLFESDVQNMKVSLESKL